MFDAIKFIIIIIFRFGSIEISCEGYDYPDDPYIVAGSCGLRYSLDYTKEGHHMHHDYGYGSNDNNYGSNDNYYNAYDSKSYKKSGMMTGVADLLAYAAMALMAWAFYKTCINPGRGTVGDRSDSTTNDDYPAGGGGGYGWNLGGGDNGGGYYRGAGTGYGDEGCGSQRRRGGGWGTGGFWTGAATGGLLGYMFGNRGGYNQGGGMFGRRNHYGGGGAGGWGGSGGSSFRSSSGGGSGTRTASGFGGTSRR